MSALSILAKYDDMFRGQKELKLGTAEEGKHQDNFKGIGTYN